MITAHVEVNVSRMLREEIASAEDLIRVALEALDQCQSRLYRTNDYAKATAISNARTELTHAMREVFP